MHSDLRLLYPVGFYGENESLDLQLVPLTDCPCRKIPWKLSTPQKRRQRKRLRLVDNVVSIVDRALARNGMTARVLERWKEEMPKEEEMLAKDKYTIFDRKEKKYRKGIHSESSLGKLAYWM